jgi:hypothetical protein
MVSRVARAAALLSALCFGAAVAAYANSSSEHFTLDIAQFQVSSLPFGVLA